MYPINFTVTNIKFCLSLHYNGANSYLFVNGTEIYKLKAKDSEFVASPLCLGNISKGWSTDNMKKTEFNGYVYDLMSRTNETRHIKWHGTCKCKCTLDAIVCNNKQQWNNDKCQCECRELIDKGICNKGYIWNPGNCKCECDKSCDLMSIYTMKTVNVEKDW